MVQSFEIEESFWKLHAMDILTEPTLQYRENPPQNQWQYFEYGVKLVLSRWTALRMAVEGGWGGGDIARKYQLFLDEILNLFKYHKNIYMDDLAGNIDEYVESQFALICEDGSPDEISTVLIALADECKAGNFSRVLHLQEAQPVPKVDLKSAKRRTDGLENEPTESSAQPTVDADGWATVPTRRSNRIRTQPQFYDPQVEFPGAQ